ncbi:hypothetical protein [Aeromicrobium sp.]|uniref:hypothetical protein n=2 Tax=Aeromicrobium sp. TaxID=1871063 RepID=UPI00351479CD
MSSMKRRVLVLPQDFPDYSWEVEAKGVFWDAAVERGGECFSVVFYDPIRLQQDVAGEVAERSAFAVSRLLVIPSVTEQHMRDAVDAAPEEFFH